MHESDQRLVTGMLNGEQRAFDQFFDAYASRLGAFVARRSQLDRDSLQDVVQISLIKAIRSLRGFRGESALFTWLCEICRNELSNCHRSMSRRAGHDSFDSVATVREAVMELHAPPEQEPSVQLESNQGRDDVRRILNSLPQRFSLALEYKYGDGLSVEQIGEILGLTTIAAQSILARARLAFRDRWNEHLKCLAGEESDERREGPT